MAAWRCLAADCNNRPQPVQKRVWKCSASCWFLSQLSLSRTERLVQADGRHQSHEQAVANWGRQRCQTGMQMCCRSRTSGAGLSAENRDANALLSYWKNSDNSRRFHSRSRLCFQTFWLPWQPWVSWWPPSTASLKEQPDLHGAISQYLMALLYVNCLLGFCNWQCWWSATVALA